MGFKDVFKKSFLEGFTSMDISAGRIMATFAVTCILACYIFLIYRLMTRKSFYSKSFNVSLAALSVITAAIILAMQSNLVISLGMVGALSIIRFRTAIKDPMDLVFLFWSISVGIICGAGLYGMALVVTVFVTIAILGLEVLPVAKPPMLLLVNASNCNLEEEILDVVNQYARHYQIKSRNLTKLGMDLVVELRIKGGAEMVREINGMEGIDSVSLLSRDGEIAG